MWTRTWPDAVNTGVLTRTTPTFDADILNEDAARAIEDLVRERYEEGGRVLRASGGHRNVPSCFGPKSRSRRSPSTSSPAMVARPRSSNFSATASKSSSPESIQTRTALSMVRRRAGRDRARELPYIRETEARELIERAADLLVADHGYIRAAARPRQKKSTPGEGRAQHGAADWQYLCDRIHAGEALHDSLRDLAAKLVASGMAPGRPSTSCAG